MSVLFGLEQMQPRKFIIVIAISCGGAFSGVSFPASHAMCFTQLSKPRLRFSAFTAFV